MGLTVTFTDTSTPVGLIAEWLWDFGDGFFDTVENPVHTYAVAGTYNVNLQIVGIYGGYSQVTHPVTVASFDWTHTFDFQASDEGFCNSIVTAVTGACPGTGTATYHAFQGWKSGNSGANDVLYIEKCLLPTLTVFKVQQITVYYIDTATGSINRTLLTRNRVGTPGNGQSILTASSVHGTLTVTAAFNNLDVDTVGVQLQQNTAIVGQFTVTRMDVSGSGVDPF